MPGFVWFDNGQQVVTRFFQGVGTSATVTTSYSFSGQAIGTADDSRYVVVALAWQGSGGNRTDTLCKIGSFTATLGIRGQNTAFLEGSALYIASVPASAGTNATILVTFDGNCDGAAMAAVYSMFGVSTAVPSVVANAAATTLVASLSIGTGGAAFGVGCSRAVAQSASWAGLTEDSDVDFASGSANTGTGASKEFATATSIVATCTFSPAQQAAGSFVVFNPS